MFYVIEQNNDLLVLKQWKCALNYPTLLASPQTSLGVRLSRIHFSPT